MKFALLSLLMVCPMASQCHSGIPVCEMAHQAEGIFVGTGVELLQLERHDGPLHFLKIRVDERLQGMEGGKSFVLLRTNLFRGKERQLNGRPMLYLVNRVLRYSDFDKYVPKDGPTVSPFAELEWVDSLECGGILALRFAAEDLKWLRAQKQGLATETRVSGKVLQNFLEHRVLALQRAVPVNGAKVELQGADATYSTTTNALGNYEIRNAAPGTYRLVAEHPEFLAPANVQVNLKPNGCAAWYLSLRTRMQFDGKLVDWEGNPKRGVRVQVIRAEPWSLEPVFERASSQAGGILTFGDTVPNETPQIGVNLTLPPTADSPYPPTVLDGALRFRMGETRRGSVYQLPKPLPERLVKVRVVDGAGKRLEEVEILCWHRGSSDRLIEKAGDAAGLFRLVEDIDYSFRADLYWRGVQLGSSAPVFLPAGKGPVEVELVVD